VLLLEVVDDLAVDIPDVVDVLALFIARAVVDDILPPPFLSKAKVSISGSSKGMQVVQIAANSYLSAPHHAEFIERQGSSSHITVEEVKKRIADLLQKYIRNGDATEACRCIREWAVPLFHHKVVKRDPTLGLCLIALLEGSELEDIRDELNCRMSLGDIADLRAIPWPPPLTLVIQDDRVSLRPTPWPSFHVARHRFGVVTSIIFLKLPRWLFDPGPEFKPERHYSSMCVPLQHAFLLLLDSWHLHRMVHIHAPIQAMGWRCNLLIEGHAAGQEPRGRQVGFCWSREGECVRLWDSAAVAHHGTAGIRAQQDLRCSAQPEGQINATA
jgi:hypothetical protein